jgi:Family of unknown function (DUF5343)
MAKIELPKKAIPPYLPHKTLVTFLQSMKVAVPARIDRSLMRSMSGGMQSQLMGALEYLQLINAENGAPTDKLTQLVRSEGAERQRILKDILTACYGFIFKGDFDLTRATSHQLTEAFISIGTSGDTTRKCVAFFMSIAKEAGFTLSPHFKKSRGRVPGISKNKQKPIHDKTVREAEKERKALENPPAEMAWEQLLLSKFPSFDPTWPDEVKTKWFDGFNDLMTKFKK